MGSNSGGVRRNNDVCRLLAWYHPDVDDADLSGARCQPIDRILAERAISWNRYGDHCFVAQAAARSLPLVIFAHSITIVP